MDLSIDKINLKNNIKFKGLEGAYNQQSSPVYKFYAPAHSADEQVVLEFAFADKDPKTAQYRIPKYIKSVPFGIDDIRKSKSITSSIITSNLSFFFISTSILSSILLLVIIKISLNLTVIFSNS